MSQSGSEIYDALAPYYREYAAKKTAYLNAVDRFIVDNTPNNAQSLLDVGAGDGIRGMALAKQKGIADVVLCDYSVEMVNRCRRLNPADVWHAAAEELPESNRRFDVIICLWNVLGHLENRNKRIEALMRMKRLLAENGVVFLDVNNRHNASAYGWIKVFGRIVVDAAWPDEKRGDASYDWKIGEKSFPAMGHLFTPVEIESIIKESGLNIKTRIAVDYNTGTCSLSVLKGQLLYQIEK